MATFDHKIFLGNRDHNFKDYKDKEISIAELSKFLGCDLVSEEEKIKVNEDNLLVPTKTLTITKNGYLIVVKDKDGKIIIEDLDELEIEPTSIKEINFGGKIDKSFKYTTEELQGAQDLQESAQALRVVGSPKKVEPADRLNSQNFAESFVEDSYIESSNINDCYWAKLSSFSGGSNGSNKLLEFLSGPNKTTVQLAPKQFFVSENKSDGGTHYDTHGIMNGGTNGPSLIGITCGNAETGTFENNVFKYENNEYLLPSGGQIIRVFRQPADDLDISSKVTYALDYMREEKTKRRDPQLFFGAIPTVYQGIPDQNQNSTHFARVYTQDGDANKGYRVQLSTKSSSYWPWIEQSSETEHYIGYDNGYQYERDATSGPFLDYLYRRSENLKDYHGSGKETHDGFWLSYDYGYDKIMSSDEFRPQSGDSQTAYYASLSFPETQMISLDDLLLGQEPITTARYPRNHLIIKNHTYNYPIKIQDTINEDKVNFNFRPITKYYRRPESGSSLGEKIDFTIKIGFSNFCLYPGEKLEKLISFKPELQHYHGRNWSEDVINNKDKNNPQNNYLGLAIKMYGKPHLINQVTSEFLYPSDCRSKPTIDVTLGEYQGKLEQFQHGGCWDLLTHRITSLSCLVLFDDEKYVGYNNFHFKDCSYKTQDNNPVLLGNKMMSPADAPEDNNFTALNTPLFYWPSMADTTNVMVFAADTSDTEAYYEQPTAGGYKLMSHSEFASDVGRGYRKTGQDRGAVAFFVEPDAAKPDFNLSSVYGWYGIDNSIHINVRYDEEQNEVVFQLVNYSLSDLDAQIEVIEIQVPPLSTSEGELIYPNETLSINQKLVFTVDDPKNYIGLGKIKSNNQVYKDNILYGEGTEEGIKPYNLTEGEN